MIQAKTISIVHHARAGELGDFVRARCAAGEWEGLSIDALCKRFTSSKTVLTRAFRRRYDVTIHAFIVGERMRYAKGLLTERLPVCDIALLSGYSCVSNFSRDFARYTGMSPMAWRLRGDGIRPAEAELNRL